MAVIDIHEEYGDDGAYALIESLQDILEDASVFPWVELGKLSRINLLMVPEDLGVYVFKDSHDGKIVYVGSATDYKSKVKGLRNRISDYLCCRNVNQDVLHKGDMVELCVRPLGTSEFASVFSLIVELYMIYKYSPIYNRRGLKENETAIGRACELASKSLREI